MFHYQHHIGDFLKDTSFLTNEEMAIYLRLMWLYYDTEQPLKDDLKALAIKANSRGKEKLVANLLEIFFFNENGAWHHSRCDSEIEEYHNYLEKQASNGRLGGRPKKPTANPPLSGGQPNHNPTITQPKPKKSLTVNRKPQTNLSIGQNLVDGFDTWWNLYDKKEDRKIAYQLWEKLNPSDELIKTIIEKTRAYVVARPDRQYRLNPPKWLRGEKWEDEVSGKSDNTVVALWTA